MGMHKTRVVLNGTSDILDGSPLPRTFSLLIDTTPGSILSQSKLNIRGCLLSESSQGGTASWCNEFVLKWWRMQPLGWRHDDLVCGNAGRRSITDERQKDDTRVAFHPDKDKGTTFVFEGVIRNLVCLVIQ